MIRFLLVAVIVIGFLILSIPVLIVEWIIGKFSPMTKEISSLRLIQGAFKFILWVAGTKITVIGEENVPKDTPVLYIGNHRSYFDILLTYSRCPIRTGYVAKKEMEKIPCLSHWMRFINCLFLDRKNIKAGLATMNEGTKLLKDGFSIAIFPEGTRSQDEDPHEFKEGSLRPALKAGVPVIPMAISGTADILENNRRFQVKPTTVHITFGQPIYPDQLERAEKKHLGATIREEIIEMRKKHKTS